MLEAAAAQHAPIARAVLFVGLLVQRAQSLHHIVEQNRLLPAWSAAQMRAASGAQASDAHEARIARFSLSVRSGSLTTWDGCSNA